MSPTGDDSLAVLLGLFTLVISVALYVWTALALGAMFRKMGEEQWKAWVPVLNQATVLKWGGFNPWWVLLGLAAGPGTVVVFVLMVVSAHRINPGFGYGGGMTVLAAFVFVVWASILGFGPARWLGARVGAPPGHRPASRAAAAAAPPLRASSVADGAVPAGPAHASDAFARASGTSVGPSDASARVGDVSVPAESPTAASWFAPPAVPTSTAWVPPDITISAVPPSASGPVRGVPGSAARPPVSPGAGAPVASPVSPLAPPPDAAPAFPTLADPASPVAASAHPSAASASPDTAPPGAAEQATEHPAPASAASGSDASDDASWPSEIDDVSAVHPSPFPPSAAAAGPYVAPPVTGQDGPIALVPGRRTVVPPARPDAPVTRVPAAPPAAVPVQRRAARVDDTADSDAFPELSGEVSAVAGSPAAGSPRSALNAVSAQQRRLEPFGDDEDDLDQTVIARRGKRHAWQLVPASGASIPLTADVVILGRRPSADPNFPRAQLVPVSEDARTVSKTHARIELRGERWLITDLDSTNGVLLRTLMGEEIEIAPGTELEVGERFFLGDEEFQLRHAGN